LKGVRKAVTQKGEMGSTKVKTRKPGSARGGTIMRIGNAAGSENIEKNRYHILDRGLRKNAS